MPPSFLSLAFIQVLTLLIGFNNLANSQHTKANRFDYDEYTRLADSFFYADDFPNALNYYMLALESELNRSKPAKNRLIQGYGNVGHMYHQKGDYRRGASFYRKAAELAEEPPTDSVELAINLANISQCMFYLGEYDQALQSMNRALEIEKKLDNLEGQSINLNAIGKIYEKWGKYLTAIDFYSMALEIEKQRNNLKGIAVRLSSIGSAYALLGDYANALKYQYEALDMDRKLGNREQLATRLQRIGMIYQQLNDYNKSDSILEEAMNIFNELSLKSPMSSVLTLQATNAWKQGNLKQALKRLEKALEIAEELNLAPQLLEIRKKMAKVHSERAEHEKAYLLLQSSYNLRDSLFNIESLRQINEFRQKYEAERIESENELLKKENDMRRRNQIILIAVTLLVIITAMAFIWILILRRKSLIQSTRLYEKELLLNQVTMESMERQNQHLQELLFAEEQIKQLQQNSLEQKDKELISNAMLFASKNEVMIKLRKLSEQVKAQVEGNAHNIAREMIAEIDRQTDVDRQWDQFRIHFEAIHRNFFTNLLKHSGKLSQTDLQICSYIKLNLQNKEIARLMHITPESATTHRYRLRKKLGLSSSESLDEFIRQLS